MSIKKKAEFVARWVVLRGIRVYQKTLSPDTGWVKRFFHGPVCRFYPTCSEYAVLSIERFGVWQGSGLAWKRLIKCHPWNAGGVDDVPSTIVPDVVSHATDGE